MKDIPDNLIRMGNEIIRIATAIKEAEIIKPSFNSFEDCLKEYEEKYVGGHLDDVTAVANDRSARKTPQENKLQAIAREIIVSTVLNGQAEYKFFFIELRDTLPTGRLVAEDYELSSLSIGPGQPYASKEAAEKAIEILGEETIKRARI